MRKYKRKRSLRLHPLRPASVSSSKQWNMPSKLYMRHNSIRQVRGYGLLANYCADPFSMSLSSSGLLRMYTILPSTGSRSCCLLSACARRGMRTLRPRAWLDPHRAKVGADPNAKTWLSRSRLNLRLYECLSVALLVTSSFLVR
jgi:hypothetical protein